jgi:hypothetical protein
MHRVPYFKLKMKTSVPQICMEQHAEYMSSTGNRSSNLAPRQAWTHPRCFKNLRILHEEKSEDTTDHASQETVTTSLFSPVLSCLQVCNDAAVRIIYCKSCLPLPSASSYSLEVWTPKIRVPPVLALTTLKKFLFVQKTAVLSFSGKQELEKAP